MSKIAVFDSGFGGLTVLSELVRELPEEDYIYYGDSAHAPFGSKTDEELILCAEEIIDRCLSLSEVKCFVVACNTTSSRVLDRLGAMYPDELFIGITPAVAAAAAGEPGGHILVLTTYATSKSRFMKEELLKHADEAVFTLLAATEIVPYVEGFEDRDETSFKVYLKELLSPFEDETDAVVLGCTHFPFVKEELRSLFKKDVRFYDAARSVARKTREILFAKGLLKSREETGSIIFLNSDPAKEAAEAELLSEYMKKEHAEAELLPEYTKKETKCS